ncbi:PHP domain-containing protein [methane-oxidizing endosymbiont of Gigantopelta aegis]|uniref:PHP domain-containing protein n=1 Tax=methane-oxidizing endosymbiont of Gigantopelta aegis TaxID=2794938 RepID=UPI0018DE5C80|nr:PHP domain-containing protein [methane-oxidizing endosymbiont of Gigantopelta aegis]
MTEIYDLHCHSTASDGALSPSQLVQRASEHGVTTLALTDHDTLKGLSEAQIMADALGIQLIPGIELSASWEKKCLHIVGLGIDPQHPALIDGIKQQQQIRIDRATKIAEKLAKKRIEGVFEAVCATAGSDMVTRLHFAQYLLQQEYVTSLQDAFDKYLGQGKSAYVSTRWATLEQTVSWITASGGIAVLAHPLRYKLTSSWLKRALTAFKQVGGRGIEVVTGQSSIDDIQRSLQLAKRFDLLASQGSDFHNPDNPWVELGRLAPMPAGIKSVWKADPLAATLN